MSDELKVGQSVTYDIAGRSLILKPLSLGKMKKSSAIFLEDGGDNMDKIARYLSAILDNNEGVTLDWISDNVTLPQANEMIDASRQINGLGSFFQKGADKAPTEIRQERPLQESPQPTPSV